jgi:hypothetical protein
VIFHVAEVDAFYAHALAAGGPRDARAVTLKKRMSP